MPRLENKVAVITGGSGGIGKAVAKRFLQEGAKVTLVDLDDADLQAAADELGGGDDILRAPADVSREDDVERYARATIDRFGTIDVLFKNAGIEGKVQPIPEISLEDFQKVQSVNVTGVFLGMKHVLPVMIDRGRGSIINTSSNAGLDGTANLAPYVTSKHAVSGMTKSAALEVASTGVRVNSVHPSPVHTRMMRSLEGGFGPDDVDAAQQDFTSRIPLGRYGEPDEIANLVLFLASDESAFITGAQYRIDGGMGATP